MVERRVGEQLLGDVVRRSPPTRAPKKRSWVSRAAAFSPQARHERAARGVGHVRREDEVRVRRAARMTADSMRSCSAIASASSAAPSSRHLPVVPLAERRRIGLRLLDIRVDARVVDALVEIGEVPRNLFRPGDLRGRHAPETSDASRPRA